MSKVLLLKWITSPASIGFSPMSVHTRPPCESPSRPCKSMKSVVTLPLPSVGPGAGPRCLKQWSDLSKPDLVTTWPGHQRHQTILQTFPLGQTAETPTAALSCHDRTYRQLCPSPRAGTALTISIMILDCPWSHCRAQEWPAPVSREASEFL